VRNITDVDDKIITRARETGVDWREHAAKYTAAMYEDLEQAGLPASGERNPGHPSTSTKCCEMIRALIERGYAYQATNGDVMYEVHKFPPYGRLSGKKLEDLRAGSRVEDRHRQA
jgi:cysteinyl-tRNA synthetase